MVDDEVIKPQSAIYEIFVLLDNVGEQLGQIREVARKLAEEEMGRAAAQEEGENA